MNVLRGIIGALCDKLYWDIKTHIITTSYISHNALLPTVLL